MSGCCWTGDKETWGPEGHQCQYCQPDHCEKCGAKLAVGQWPWCPHGDARRFGEQPMEPYWDEMVSPSGEHFTTRAERRRFMAKNNLEYHDVSKKRRGRIFVDMGKR